MRINIVRKFVQWHALVAANLYLGFFKTKQVYQGALKSVCVPFLNCHSCPSALFSCPIGVLQHFMTIRKVPFTLLGYLFGIGILVGSAACGWLCPFGFIQDLMHKIKSFKITLPKQLSILRYFILIFLVLLIPLITQETWFSKLCPMGTMQAAIPWVLWNPIIPVYAERAVSTASIGFLLTVKICILMLCLMLFVVSRRPFCRILCPLGAIFGLFNKYSLLKLKVDKKNCKKCFKCSDECPVDLNVSEDANATTCVRCLRCLKCDNVRLQMGESIK